MPFPHRSLSTVAWLTLLASLVCVLCSGCNRSPKSPERSEPQQQESIPQPVDPRRTQAGEFGKQGAAGTANQPAQSKADHEELDQEDAQRVQRQHWVDLMHRAPSGQDWREIEARNRRAERERRNQALRNLYPDGERSALARRLAALGPQGIGVAQARLRSPQFTGQNQTFGELLIPSQGWWEEIGSRNQAGHTRSAVLGPEHMSGRTLYVGSAGGGLWQGTELGEHWTPLSDGLFGGADEIIVLPGEQSRDPDRLLFRQGSSLYRSVDAGLTWTQPSGLHDVVELLTVQRLFDGNQTIVALANTNGTGQGLQTWVLRSTDGGQSFQPLWQAPELGRGDLWTPQSGPRAGTGLHLALNGRFYRSDDGGQNFQVQASCMVGVTDSHLTGSEEGGTTLYTVLRATGQWNLVRSDDGGATCTPLGQLTDYWGSRRSMVALSTDRTQVIYGGVNAYRSGDSGVSFTAINHWGEYYANPASKLHADMRGLDVQRVDEGSSTKDYLYFNTDGGTYLSKDGGLSVTNLSLEGLGVGQFYSTLTSTLDPRNMVGGTQDQGYQIGSRQGTFGVGPSTAMVQAISGDYGHLTSGDGTHDLVFSVYPGVTSSSAPGFVLIQTGETNPNLQSIPFPPANNSLWMPPILADPSDPQAFYFLADQLWRASNNGLTWNFATHSSHDFAQAGSSFLSALGISPANPQRMVALTNAGNIWWSIDAGQQWNAASDSGPGAHYFYGSKLLPHPIDPHHLVAAGSGYGSPGVRVSYDGGDHWVPLGRDLPTTLFYDIEWSPEQNGDLYAATEAGAYRYIAARDRWENLMGLQAPATTYWSVESVPSEHRMRFGTYGRGIWDYVLALPVRPVGDPLCHPAIANSTFVPGSLELVGIPFATRESLQLSASDLPPNEMGFFMMSANSSEAYTPGWSDGFLCLDGSFHIFGSQATGPGGNMQHTLDLQDLPTPTPMAILAGQTWYFQAWHSDFVLVPTGNFTDAVGVLFH